MSKHLVWETINGKNYWYENDAIQGTEDDPLCVLDGNGEPRGREIYDPGSDAWYWLDAAEGGARAENKEVWIPYVYQGVPDPDGKWVRYDADGHMVKGLYITDGKVYVYHQITGAMAKGTASIRFSFDAGGVCNGVTVLLGEEK